MIKTLASIFITIALIFGLSFYEQYRIQSTFSIFNEALISLRDKTEAREVTYEDGRATGEFWENTKNTLHVWLPHGALLEIDYQ